MQQSKDEKKFSLPAFKRDDSQPIISSSQKWEKRILRKKVASIIDDSMEENCIKIHQYNRRAQYMAKNYQYIKVKTEVVQPIFKTGRYKRLDSIVDQYFYQDQPGDTQKQFNSFKNLYSSLSQAQIQEVSEDPTYFINQDRHKQVKQFTNRSNWECLTNSEVHDDDPYLVRLKQFLYSKKNTQEQDLTKKSQLNDSIQLSRSRVSGLKSVTEVSTLLKRKEIVEQARQQLIDNHNRLQKRFDQFSQIQKQQKSIHDQNTQQNYLDKIEKSQILIENQKQQKQKLNFIKQQKEQKRQLQIQSNMIKMEETKDIDSLNEILKSICKERKEINLNKYNLLKK